MARLRVRRERLAELTTDDLERVAGAAATDVPTILKLCVSERACTTFPSCGCPPTQTC